MPRLHVDDHFLTLIDLCCRNLHCNTCVSNQATMSGENGLIPRPGPAPRVSEGPKIGSRSLYRQQVLDVSSPLIPSQSCIADPRITIAYFCLSGLDLLGVLEVNTSKDDRRGWIEWIWSLQARKTSNGVCTDAKLLADFMALPI